MDTASALPAPKKRRVPPKVREAVDLIVQGHVKTITSAAKAVGLSRERLSRALGEPHIAEHLQHKAQRQIAISSGAAAARLSNLIWGAESEHVAFKASEAVLAINGMAGKNSAQVNVNVQQQAGYVIILGEEPKDRIVCGAAASKIIDGTSSNAKPIIDVDAAEPFAPVVTSRRG